MKDQVSLGSQNHNWPNTRSPHNAPVMMPTVRKQKAKNEALHEEKRVTREKLRELSRADTLDESRLRELVRKQSDQRADMMIAKHATRNRINQLLTPEQQEQHEAFRQQRQERRGASKHRQERQ